MSIRFISLIAALLLSPIATASDGDGIHKCVLQSKNSDKGFGIGTESIVGTQYGQMTFLTLGGYGTINGDCDDIGTQRVCTSKRNTWILTFDKAARMFYRTVKIIDADGDIIDKFTENWDCETLPLRG